MAYNAKKLEHAGAKRGRGAYYGQKRDAKHESSRRRRHQLGKLLKDVTACNVHGEIETGPPVGTENL